METFCGIDWSDDHHDVAVIDRDGQVLAHRQIGDDHAGLQALLELLSEHGDRPDRPVPVAIETSHGLLVAAARDPAGSPDQPAGCRALPHPHRSVGPEVRPCGRGHAGEHSAHRSARAPAATR